MLSSEFLKNLLNFIPLMQLHIHAMGFRILEGMRVALNYWRRLPFLFCDLWLSISYFIRGPYQVFIRNNYEGEPYGETPLSTLDQIARECRLLSKDIVVDLGCGRGRGVFWLASFVKCRTIGIERIPTFVRRANRIKKHLKLDRVLFWQGEIKEMDLSQATAVYLYGTAFGDNKLKEIIDRLSSVKAGTKVITVSFPLEEVGGGEAFLVKKAFPARFPWGKTMVYLQEKAI